MDFSKIKAIFGADADDMVEALEALEQRVAALEEQAGTKSQKPGKDPKQPQSP